jgi:tetratricopeptide (TPR) repeat protein
MTTVISGLPAAAADDRETCKKADSWVVQRAACTRAINSGRYRERDLAEIYLQRGDNLDLSPNNNSIRDYTEAIRVDPTFDKAYATRGYTWYLHDDFNRAIRDYTEAIRLNPTDGYYVDRGNAWRKKGDLDRAIADYTEAIRLNPKNGWSYSYRGKAWYGKGDLDRAIADSTEAIRLIPKLALSYRNRGNAWRDKGNLDRAIADYTEANRIDPKHIQERIWEREGDRNDRGDRPYAGPKF